MTTLSNSIPVDTDLLSDEMLMAYADGLLDPEPTREIEALLLSHPQAAAKVQAFMESAALAQRGFGDAPAVSEALLAKVQSMVAKAQTESPSIAQQQVESKPELPMMQAPAQRVGAAANSSWYAMVATVACVAVGVASYFAGAYQAQGSGSLVASSQDSTRSLQVLTADSKQAVQLQRALSQLASGQQTQLAGQTPATLLTQASLRDASGALCREFVVSQGQQATQAVACLSEPSPKPSESTTPSWQLRYFAALPASSQGFTPASSNPAIDAYLSSIGASAALSAQDEAKALAQIK